MYLTTPNPHSNNMNHNMNDSGVLVICLIINQSTTMTNTPSSSPISSASVLDIITRRQVTDEHTEQLCQTVRSFNLFRAPNDNETIDAYLIELHNHFKRKEMIAKHPIRNRVANFMDSVALRIRGNNLTKSTIRHD